MKKTTPAPVINAKLLTACKALPGRMIHVGTDVFPRPTSCIEASDIAANDPTPLRNALKVQYNDHVATFEFQFRNLDADGDTVSWLYSCFTHCSDLIVFND